MIYESAINSDGLQNQWCLLLFLYVCYFSFIIMGNSWWYYNIISERCRRLGLSPPRHWEFHVSAHIICHHSACCGQINWLPTCMGQQCILMRGAEILCCDRDVSVLCLRPHSKDENKNLSRTGRPHITQDPKFKTGGVRGRCVGITIRFGDRVNAKEIVII